MQAELFADVVAQLPVVELVRGVVACLAAKVYHNLGVGAAEEQLLDTSNLCPCPAAMCSSVLPSSMSFCSASFHAAEHFAVPRQVTTCSLPGCQRV